VSPPRGTYPTTRAGRAQRAAEAAARRAASAVSDEEINAAAAAAAEQVDTMAEQMLIATGAHPDQKRRITLNVPPPPEPLVEPGELLEFEGGWKLAQKVGRTLVRRMPGPFEVDTSEGTMRCADGWLALDAAGNPYPIEAGVFGRSYVVSADASRPDLATLAPGLAAKVRPA
jgi:hypothetical protein